MRKLTKWLSAAALFVLIFAFSVTGAKAAGYDFNSYYVNSETGYSVLIFDEAQIYSASELRQLAEEMQAATAYGNIVLYTTENNPYYSVDALGDSICQALGYSSTTVFIIDFDTRKIQLQSSGKNESRMTPAKAYSITDNVYTYASDKDYFTCAMKAFEQVNLVLDGARIAQPMKYVSNVLLAVTLALMLNYFAVKITSANKKVSEKELFKNIAEAYLHYDTFNVRHLHTDKKYSPQSSGGSGGGGGGGGGGHSSGGGHSF